MICKKCKFKNKYDADNFINNLDIINNDNHYLRSYKCDRCDFFHITKKKINQKNIKLKFFYKFKKLIKNGNLPTNNTDSSNPI